jgi:hypothetical protein
MYIGILRSTCQPLSHEATGYKDWWVGSDGILMSVCSQPMLGMEWEILSFLAADTSDLDAILVGHVTWGLAMFLPKVIQSLQVWWSRELGIISIQQLTL